MDLFWCSYRWEPWSLPYLYLDGRYSDEERQKKERVMGVIHPEKKKKHTKHNVQYVHPTSLHFFRQIFNDID